MSNAAGWFWALAASAVFLAYVSEKESRQYLPKPAAGAQPVQVEAAEKRPLLYVDETVTPYKARDIANIDAYAPNIYDRPSFGSYDCTQDCSGHMAGYEWAEDNGIEDPSDCGGNSQSFIEGCEEYAEEQVSSYDYGQEWAEDNDIDNVSDCAGDGDAYDGCADYVEEQVGE